MEVICGPCVLIVMDGSCKDYGENLQLSQPLLRERERKIEKINASVSHHQILCLVSVPMMPQWLQGLQICSGDHIIKTLERLVLEQLMSMVRPLTDPPFNSPTSLSGIKNKIA